MIFCPRCKQQSPDNSPRCVHCGFPDSIAPQSPQMASPAQQVPPPQMPPQPPQQQMSATQRHGIVEAVLGEFVPGVKGNLFFLLALCIPIVNILVLIKAGFAKDAPPLKSSFLKAWLIIVGVAIVIGIIISVISGIVMASAASKAFDFARYF